jgi:hypothetical protein
MASDKSFGGKAISKMESKDPIADRINSDPVLRARCNSDHRFRARVELLLMVQMGDPRAERALRFWGGQQPSTLSYDRLKGAIAP